MRLDKKGGLFYNNGREKKQTFNLDGPDDGCSGADWEVNLERPHDKALHNLRAFVIRFLAQKGQELATERHYSLVVDTQSNNRDKMQPESLEKRYLF